MYGMGLGRKEKAFRKKKVNERRENIKKILKNIKWKRSGAKKTEENLFINNILHLKWSFLNRKMDMNELGTFSSILFFVNVKSSGQNPNPTIQPNGQSNGYASTQVIRKMMKFPLNSL